MKDELWAQITIAVHPNTNKKDENGVFKANHYHYHIIKEWRYPRWIINKRNWFFNWVCSIIQVRFPKHKVSYIYCGFYPETREKALSKRQLSINAAKAQVTRYENKIALLKKWSSETLFSDYTDHPLYPKFKCKLEEKKENLKQAILMSIEETI